MQLYFITCLHSVVVVHSLRKGKVASSILAGGLPIDDLIIGHIWHRSKDSHAHFTQKCLQNKTLFNHRHHST